MAKNNERCDLILTLLRKITRAVDLHSKQLIKKYGLTGPQMLILKIVVSHQEISSGELARIANLSHPTVTSILDRLSQKDYVQRKKSNRDKRKVFVSTTDLASKLFASNPSLLQEDFVEEFEQLKDWEQSLLISSLERIAGMMSAKEIDASPYLAPQSRLDA